MPRSADPARERLLSLDAFRGLTIAAMLLVNNPGTWSAVYPPLRHAEWHGWTPTDLIFPFFLFIVGVSMTFSIGGRLERGTGRGPLFAKVVRRALVLFTLGLLLHGFPYYADLGNLRIPGVLQRIALAYLAAAAIFLLTGRRGQASAAALLLLGYWALLTLVPVPGSGEGVLEPGRDLGAWIDRAVFGENHLWAASRTWDPEGLLSTLPAVATVLTGVFAGRVLRSADAPAAKITRLSLAGTALTLAGMAWSLVLPINKSLWTSSYVLFSSGLGFLALALCYALVDVRGLRRAAMPAVVFGVNAIAAFFLSGLLARLLGLIRVPGPDGDVALKAFLYERAFAPFAPPEAASLAFAIAFVLLWLALLWPLHRRRIFIRV